MENNEKLKRMSKVTLKKKKRKSKQKAYLL